MISKRTKRKGNKSTIIDNWLVALYLANALIFVFIAFYVTYNRDDFLFEYLLSKHGIWGTMKLHYNWWDGRAISLPGFLNLWAIKTFSPSGTVLFWMFFFFLSSFLLAYFILRRLKQNIENRMLILLGLILASILWMAILRDAGRILYNANAATYMFYIFSLIVFLTTLYDVKNMWIWILGMLIGTQNSTHMAGSLFFIAIIYFINEKINKGIFPWKKTAVFIMVMGINYAITMSAPGNSVRLRYIFEQEASPFLYRDILFMSPDSVPSKMPSMISFFSEHPEELSPGEILGRLIVIFKRIYRYFLFFWVIMVIIIGVCWTIKIQKYKGVLDREEKITLSSKWRLVWDSIYKNKFLISSFLIIPPLLVGVFTPARVFLPIVIFFILWLVDRWPQKVSLCLKKMRAKWSWVGIGGIIMIIALGQLIGAMRIYKLLEQRHQYLISQKGKEVVVPWIDESVMPEVIKVRQLEKDDHRPFNTAVSLFYGLKSFHSTKDTIITELPPLWE